MAEEKEKELKEKEADKVVGGGSAHKYEGNFQDPTRKKGTDLTEGSTKSYANFWN